MFPYRRQLRLVLGDYEAIWDNGGVSAKVSGIHPRRRTLEKST
jgi:hypothetical protein